MEPEYGLCYENLAEVAQEVSLKHTAFFAFALAGDEIERGIQEGQQVMDFFKVRLKCLEASGQITKDVASLAMKRMNKFLSSKINEAKKRKEN